jgi:hypothetical protein
MADEATSYIILDLPGEGGKHLASAGASWRVVVRSPSSVRHSAGAVIALNLSFTFTL